MSSSKLSPSIYTATNNNLSKSWVMLINGSVLSEGITDIVKLKHPRSGLASMFLFTCNDAVVQELFVFSEKRSWFINNFVRENGNLYISTPIDPLFLILPYLKNSKLDGKVLPAADLLHDNTFPETNRLLQSSAFKNIHLLADRKGPEDLNAWMYNEEKTVSWLSKKVEKVVQALKHKQINLNENATSQHFTKLTDKKKDIDDKLFLKYACNLVSEYLTDDLCLKLQTSLGLPLEPPEKIIANKRKSIDSCKNDGKKFKFDEESITGKHKNKNTSRKEKTIPPPTNGTKSIMSYFKMK